MKKILLLASAIALTIAPHALAVTSISEEKKPQMSSPEPFDAYQPLVIVGEGWSQQFVLQNVGDYRKIPLTGKLRFFTQNGQPWRIGIRNVGMVSEVPFNIPLYGSLTIETEVLYSPQQLGWMEVLLPEDFQKANYFHAHTIFKRQEVGRPELMTSAPMTNVLLGNAVTYFDNTGGNTTGVAILNPSNWDENVTILLFGEDGQPYHQSTRKLKKGEMVWLSLNQEFPQSVGRRGQMLVTGSLLGCQTFSLQFTPNGSFTAISTSADF